MFKYSEENYLRLSSLCACGVAYIKVTNSRICLWANTETLINVTTIDCPLCLSVERSDLAHMCGRKLQGVDVR